MKITNEKRKSYNRAISVLILGLGVSAWVIINNYPSFTLASWLYVSLMIISAFLYWIWDKF